MTVVAKSVLIGALIGTFVMCATDSARAAPLLLIGRPAAQQNVSFSVTLPLRHLAQLEQLIALQSDPRSPLYHHFLTVGQFRREYGPAAQGFASVAGFFEARGLTVVQESSQRLRVHGTAAAVERTLDVRLGLVRDARGRSHIAGSSRIRTPSALVASGATIGGLEPRVRMRVQSRPAPVNRSSPFGSYWFDDLKQAYDYPSNHAFNGTGANIGVLMDSDVLDSDLTLYLEHERYSEIAGKAPMPLKRVVVGEPSGVDVESDAFFEASLDVQTEQGSAPGAQVWLYNASSMQDEDLLDAYGKVVDQNFVDVLSSSFGICELDYTAAYNGGVDFLNILRAFHAVFDQGTVEGITFVAASGDYGGLGCPDATYFSFQPDPGAHFVPTINEPASDPNVTAVGGTNLQTTAPQGGKQQLLRSAYVGENAYADPLLPFDQFGYGILVPGGYWGSGSGRSALWLKPWYQDLVTTGSAYRTIPDISMQMGGCPFGSIVPCHPGDSRSSYYINGTAEGAVGTSLSSPEFAGLLALKIGASKSRLGNANGYIYELAAADAALPPGFPERFFHTDIPGYNGIVRVAARTRGYNPIVGVGTPVARNFLGVPDAPPAGDPRTRSNP